MIVIKDTISSCINDGFKSEEKSRLFYLEASNIVQSLEVKKRLLELAKEEERHRDLFAKKIDDVKLTETLLKEVEKPSVDNRNRSLTVIDVLSIAIEKEREAETHYKFLAEKTEDHDLWVFLLALSEEERRHKTVLMREKESLQE